MMFATGILVWIALGVGAGLLFRAFYRGPTTTAFLSLCFGVFGALVGGMLGVAGYIAHDPGPLRFGGLLGAVLGAVLFSFVYNAAARRFI
ncbi:MAG TPA: hypothetical protein VMM12_01760 [Longimicrobiales bacterium]|nr:hypothetical protein [Longimicrobiales bacterium]